MSLTTPCNRHYPKAPITEAVLDLRIQTPAHLRLEALQELQARNSPAYPTLEPMMENSGLVHLGPPHIAHTHIQSTPIGYLSRSADEKQLFQARLNGFTLSRMAPYGTWETFRSEARRLWTAYREVVGPARIERMALRYINRIDIPHPAADFTRYLTTLPTLSQELPQTLSGYFMHLLLPIAEVQGTAIINQTILDPPPVPAHVCLIIDIDLFRTASVPDDEGVWALLETFRHVKNNIFEACITDQSRELFQ